MFLFILQIVAPGLVIECRSDTPQFEIAKGVVIIEILPFPRGGGQETEDVQLLNIGTSSMNLSGWALCDTNDCATIPAGNRADPLTKGSWLEPGETTDLVQNMSRFGQMAQNRCPAFAQEGIYFSYCHVRPFENGSRWPTMTNAGDFIWLQDADGSIIDAVAFGKAYQGRGWTGEPGPAPRTGWAMVREFRLDGTKPVFQDTNTSEDWPVYRTRRAEDSWEWMELLHGAGLVRDDIETKVKVVPLVFPEDGEVLAGILTNVANKMFINTYEFTSYSMAKIIADRARAGVEVDVLVEAHPVGGITHEEVVALNLLLQAGCEVRLIGSNGTDDPPGPFGLDHAKYIVDNNNLTIVMSENMVPSALGTAKGTGNRGWGIVIEGADYSYWYARNHFIMDWDLGTDAREVIPTIQDIGNMTQPANERPLYPGSPGSLPKPGRIFYGTANCTFMFSPEATEDILLDIINGTKERLYIELLSFDFYWHLQSGVTEKQMSPLLDAVVAAARRGVEVKVLLDSSFLDTSDNDEVVAYLNEVANAEGLKLEARLADIPNITLVHNKGMIADDLVLVSSINWVDSAVRDNREVGVAIRMKGLDDLYVSYFMKDWQPQAQPPGDGPGPTNSASQSQVLPICGSLLAFGAITLALFVLMRRGRHEQP